MVTIIANTVIEHTSLFYTLAQIAGVFVGFAALIAVSALRSENPGDTEQQALTGVVMAGLFAIIGGLLPILLSI